MKTIKEYISTAEGAMQMWDKINEVLDNFDFMKVKTVMEALDWGWACSEAEGEMYEDEGCKVDYEKNLYYPEYPQLLKHARDLIAHCISDMPEKETEWSVSTGGFMVKIYIATDEERADYYGEEIANVDDFAHSVDITLQFIVEESTSY